MKTCLDCPASLDALHGNRIRCPACATRQAKERTLASARKHIQRREVVTWLKRQARAWPNPTGAELLQRAAEQVRTGRDEGAAHG